jgi:hypothetical protein
VPEPTSCGGAWRCRGTNSPSPACARLMVHTASGWGEPDDPDAHHLWRPADATELLIVVIRCTERQHAQYPLLRHVGRGADCRTGVVMICRRYMDLCEAAEAASQTSRPLSLTASRHGALLHAARGPSTRRCHQGRRRGLAGKCGDGFADLPGSITPSVPWKWPRRGNTTWSRTLRMNGSARYGSLLRGARKRTQDRRERHAGGLIVSVLASYGGEPLGPAGHLRSTKRARRCTCIGATNLYSPEHAEDQCREVHIHGVLGR